MMSNDGRWVAATMGTPQARPRETRSRSRAENSSWSFFSPRVAENRAISSIPMNIGSNMDSIGPTGTAGARAVVVSMGPSLLPRASPGAAAVRTAHGDRVGVPTGSDPVGDVLAGGRRSGRDGRRGDRYRD